MHQIQDIFTQTIILVLLTMLNLLQIQETLFFTIGGLSIGTLLYILGRYQGKKDGFDYSARMEKDYHLLEK